MGLLTTCDLTWLMPVGQAVAGGLVALTLEWTRRWAVARRRRVRLGDVDEA